MIIASICVDPQVDFTVGALETNPENSVFSNIAKINENESIDLLVVTGDKHYKGSVDFDVYGAHCLAGTKGVKFDSRFNDQHMDMIIYKGQDIKSAGHSAFFDDAGNSTGLLGYIKDRYVNRLVISGFVLDICVLATVLDACKNGYDVYVALDACQVYDEEAKEEAINKMRHAGAKVMNTNEILEELI